MAISKVDPSEPAVGTARMQRREGGPVSVPAALDMKVEAARTAKVYANSFKSHMDENGKVIWCFLFTMPEDPKASGTAVMTRRSASGDSIPPQPPQIEKLVRMDPDFKKATEWGLKTQKELGAKSVTIALYARDKK